MLSMKSSSSSENVDVVLALPLLVFLGAFGDFLVMEMEPKSLGLSESEGM